MSSLTNKQEQFKNSKKLKFGKKKSFDSNLKEKKRLRINGLGFFASFQ
jgi:hypothetical protein